MTTIIGIDVGGGGARVALARAGKVTVARDDGAIQHAQSNVDTDLVVGRVKDTAAQLGGTLDVDAVGIGITGLPGLVDPERLAAGLSDAFRPRTLVVAGDSVTTHVGALGFTAGAILAAGTGAIALGTDLRTVWHQVDGWGPLVGDEGSGAWIGMRGLSLALREHDGRPGRSPRLLTALKAQFGSVARAIEVIYSETSPAHLIASFAPSVAGAAEAGDVLATRIWHEAGAQLAHSVVAAVADLPPRVSWGGGLFEAGELLLEPFLAEVRRQAPEAEIVYPAGTSLDGALALARAAQEGEIGAAPPYLHVWTGDRA